VRPVVSDSSPWSTRLEPRAWQREALAAWLENGLRGVVSVVTGGGKTVFAELCMIEFEAREANAQHVVIVPTLALMDQWFVALREDIGTSENDIATYSGRGRPRDPKRVNLVVLNTAREVGPRLAGGRPSLLIVDECHRALSPVNSLALHGPYAARLGLSATPERSDDAGPSFTGSLLGDVIYRYDYVQARIDGVISPFRLINVEVALSSAEQEEYDNLTTRIQRIGRGESDSDSEAVRRHLLIRRARVSATAGVRIPVSISLAARHCADRVIVFHEQIAAAEAINDALVARQVRSTIYHSELGEALRRENLRLFRRGIFDVLVTCRALDEGLNVPDCAVALIASSTASPRQRIQRLGRVLRPSPGKVATVYTLYATDPEERRLALESRTLSDVAEVAWKAASSP